jgi:hypothetical protein
VEVFAVSDKIRKEKQSVGTYYRQLEILILFSCLVVSEARATFAVLFD